ncbi:haloacid dehalogenase-like hydrolase [Bosea caraganae]|uniref:Haloacid dehalogenase-like hydrolase n=1 Tax=Bosea caraganae TaxID=2763117 RepID=A0A370L5D7_9HYPH|nr:HAD family hydrolase [Bosea caraganae]RDJ24266.1 haloacid dehalogenase-like hydrolase [Bosea caraganae]RDJ30308.1 haloacid dehalogenase-like hydrolase [Bosea caraganae]
MSKLRAALAALLLAGMGAWSTAALAQSDPLPSWNDGKAKQAILAFVGKVTQEGGADFVRPEQRIATFDNDGTLWAEQPIYFQVQFAFDEVKRLVAQRPELKGKEPYRSVIARDIKGLTAGGGKGLLQVMAATHAGMTTEDFAGTVGSWLASARHPTKQRPYTEMVYQPQLELLAYLRANGFKTFIVSGGGIEFMRVFAEKAYGIPPEQVVGSTGVVTFRLDANGKPQLFKEAKVEFVDDGPGKPVGINRLIGRRPILAFGNSDGDLQMLQYTAAGQGARLALIVHHTDAEREWAYDRTSPIGKLDKALDEATAKGWTIVDMKMDWKTIFPVGR